MTDIWFFNSLVESWWRAIKHQCLYLNTLNTTRPLKKLLAVYVDVNNHA